MRKFRRRKFKLSERMQLIGLQTAWNAQYAVCKAIESAAHKITGEDEWGRASDWICSDEKIEKLEENMNYDIDRQGKKNSFNRKRNANS